jgi:hypothetical protein
MMERFTAQTCHLYPSITNGLLDAQSQGFCIQIMYNGSTLEPRHPPPPPPLRPFIDKIPAKLIPNLMHTIDDLKDCNTIRRCRGDSEVICRHAREHYFEFHRFSADVGGVERIGLFDYEKNQEIINLIMQDLNCDGSNGPIAQPNGLAGG